MSSRELLGLKLNQAIELAQGKGMVVETLEVRSKKGIENGIPIVIRQRLIDINTIELCFSRFIIDVAGENEG